MRPSETFAINSAIERFTNWLGFAKRGSTFTYHRGLLSEDRQETLTTDVRHLTGGAIEYTRTTVPVEPVDSLATEVYGAYRAGRVFLLQRREGPADYTYMAVKRR